MTTRETQLAILLRAAQWHLDEAAFNVGSGNYSHDEYIALADALHTLAHALRTHAEQLSTTTIDTWTR